MTTYTTYNPAPGHEVIQFADGATYHLYATAYETIENNCRVWHVVYAVNGKAYTMELYAGRALYAHHLYIATRADAILVGLMLAGRLAMNAYKAQERAYPDTPEKRKSAILWLLKHDHVLQKMVHGAYPKVWTSELRIQCDSDHQAILADAIAHLTDGVTVVWDTIEYKPFRSSFADTERIPTLDPALLADDAA